MSNTGSESAFASDFGWKVGEWPSEVYFHDTLWFQLGPFFHNRELGGYEYEDSRNNKHKLIVFND